MKPIEAVLSFNRKLAFYSVTLSKEKWLVNWFCFTISKRTSFCMPHPSNRHFRFGSCDGLSLHHEPESLLWLVKHRLSNDVLGVNQLLSVRAGSNLEGIPPRTGLFSFPRRFSRQPAVNLHHQIFPSA